MESVRKKFRRLHNKYCLLILGSRVNTYFSSIKCINVTLKSLTEGAVHKKPFFFLKGLVKFKPKFDLLVTYIYCSWMSCPSQQKNGKFQVSALDEWSRRLLPFSSSPFPHTIIVLPLTILVVGLFISSTCRHCLKGSWLHSRLSWFAQKGIRVCLYTRHCAVLTHRTEIATYPVWIWFIALIWNSPRGWAYLWTRVYR